MITINQTNNKYSPTFKEYKHAITNNAGVVVNRGDTCLFRQDLEFDKLIHYLEKKYNNIAKVNIIAHACSDGEEAYSFVSKLLDMIGMEKANKYLPFSAHDINDEHLKFAANGKYKIKQYEYISLFKNLGSRLKNYFELIGDGLSDNLVTVKESLKQHVTFKKSNIVEDIGGMQLKNTVLFARNVWPYLSNNDANKLAKELSEKMDGTSTLVLGDFDKMYNIDVLLYKYDLIESDIVDNVFEKRITEPIKKPSNFTKYIKKLGRLIN